MKGLLVLMGAARRWISTVKQAILGSCLLGLVQKLFLKILMNQNLANCKRLLARHSLFSYSPLGIRNSQLPEFLLYLVVFLPAQFDLAEHT